MKKPDIPANETQRLKALHEYNLLDTLPEKDFDDITKIASQICGTPISLITLVDENRQWFKSHHGLDVEETPREYAFCAHAINKPQEILMVNDSREDERFADNPLVTGKPEVIFYAGVPLVNEHGFALGTLCIIDKKPKTLDPAQQEALISLSSHVVNLLELRKKNIELNATKRKLQHTIELFEESGEIARVGGWEYDILNNILSWTAITKKIHEVPQDFVPQLEDGINFYKEGESREIITSLVKKAMHDGTAFDAQLQIVTAKGNEIWVRSKGHTEFVDGKCVRLFGVFQDINAEKLKDILIAEKQVELEKTVALFEQTGKIARLGGWELDLVNKKRLWSSITKEILEVPNDYMPDFEKGLNPYKDSETEEKITAFVNDAIEKGLPFDTELQIVTAKGNTRWVRTKGEAEFEQGKCVRVHGIFQDIHAEKLKDILLAEKQTELEKALELFEQTSQVAKIGGWDVNLKNNKVTWTNVTKEIHEVPDDFVLDIEKGVDFYKPGESQEIISQVVKQALETETCYDLELQLITAKGNERWVRTKGQSVFEDGKCVRLYGIIQDIHAEKLKDIKLAQSEEQFRQTFVNSAIGMALLNLDGKWLKANKSLCHLLGYTEKELQEMAFAEITPQPDLIKEMELFNKLVSGELQSYEIEKRFIHKGGHLIWVIRTVSVINNEENQPDYLVSQVVDITARKEAEQLISKERKLLRTVIDNIPVNIFIKDLQSRKTLVNRKELDYLGIDDESELLGKSDWDLYPEDSAKISVEEDKAVFETGVAMINKETMNEKTDGLKTWFLTSKIPLRDDHNNIVSLLGISYDINDRKELEHKTKLLMDVTNEQNSRLVNFAHIVSHNLRTHAGNIATLVGFYEQDETEIEKQKTFDLIKIASAELQETINNVNEIVAVNTNIDEKLEAINLHKAIEKVQGNINALLIEHHAQCINQVETSINIRGVPAYIESILLNFFTNSIKYRSRQKTPVITLTSRCEGDFAVLSFNDNGSGIDMNRFGDKLFGMYKTFHGNEDARGVGLFITKNQIEAMGGKISVESVVGEGTTFKIYFKVVREIAVPASKNADALPAVTN